jgi:hypothetical protein
MKYLKLALVAVGLALAAAPGFASHLQGMDIEAGTHLTTKECLALQTAKDDRSSRADRQNACKWTADHGGSSAMSSDTKPRPVDAAPYGLPPDALNSPW